MTDELKGLLSSQVDDVELRPGAAAAALAGAASRHRARAGLVLALAAGLVVSGVGAALVLGGDDGGERETLAAPPAPADPNAALLVRDGDRVTISGRVVQVPGSGPEVCGSEAFPSIGYAPGAEPAPGRCIYGLPLKGVDLDALTDRREKEGAVEGYAALVATFRDGVLVVEQQSAPDPGVQTSELPVTQPPCPAPEGGWAAGSPPRLDVNLSAQQPALEAFTADNPGLVVELALARPDGPVLVLLARDEAARAVVDAALRETYGSRLCVVVARATVAEVEAAKADVQASMTALRVSSFGFGVDDAFQQQVSVDLLRVDDAALALAARHPEGLVDLVPALRPLP